MKVYIAGPMRGYPNFNYDQFNCTARQLRQLGYEVVNPAENFDGDQNKTFAEYMRKDIADVLSVDALIMLPGWQKSQGASLEASVAKAIGIPLFTYEGGIPTIKEIGPESSLQEAQRLVHGDRGADYGHPLDNFEQTAALWSAILGFTVTAEQVALCMIAVKISRECNAPKRDNRVDIAGYAETLQMVHDERKRRATA